MEGSIVSFFHRQAAAQKTTEKASRRKSATKRTNIPITPVAAKEAPVIIDLCSESDAGIAQVKPSKKKLRLSPEIDCFDEAQDDLESNAALTETYQSVVDDIVEEEEEFELEGAIGSLGLDGSHNPDYEDDERWQQQEEEVAEQASSEDDSENEVVWLDRDPSKEPSPTVSRDISPSTSMTKLSTLSDISTKFTYNPDKSALPPANKAKGKGKDPLKPTAFTALMTGHAEDKAWKKAAKSEKLKGNKFKRGQYREAPFYKILEGMPIAVDGFRYGAIPGVKAYFLSHAHSDHYQLLSASWTYGPVYCSQTTANLIIMNLGVKSQYVKPMQFDQPIDVAGVKVTMMDANHCPGSSIFLFEGKQTTPGSPYAGSDKIFRYLHCGDFRASPRHLLHPAMVGKKIDICYLDTTYCAPSHQFPAQEQVIQACADLIRSRICEGDTMALKRGQANAQEMIKAEEMFKGWLTKGKKEEIVDSDELGNCAKEEEDRSTQLTVKEEEGELVQDSTSMDMDCGEPVDKPVDDNVRKEIEDLNTHLPAKLEEDDKKNVKKENILVLVGTYSIGKERIVKGIAKAIGSKIYCGEHKYKLMECIDEDPELRSLLTRDPLNAQIHVTGLFAITRENLGDYLDSFKGHFTKIIGLRPTGWTFKPEGAKNKIPAVHQTILNQTHKNYSPAYLYPQRDSTERLQAYGVPYSEHSSFRELTCFCVSMDHVRIIATVNVHSDASRAKMKAWFERWQAERKRRREAGEPQMVPYRTLDYW